MTKIDTVPPALLDEELLTAYISNFYGYGDYTADVWLVGMEEGGGSSIQEVSRRLQIWDELGRQELADVGEVHARTNLEHMSKWFRTSPPPPIQPTWGPLIRLIFGLAGKSVSPEEIRAYQGTILGRSGGACILELFPLPAAGKGVWLYNHWSELPYLQSRPVYEKQLVGIRADHITKRIRQHQPKAVVFYSLGDRPKWERAMNLRFAPARQDGLYFAADASTLYVATKHPVAHGVTGAYFEDAGRTIAQKLDELGRHKQGQ